jgi:putative membrane protein
MAIDRVFSASDQEAIARAIGGAEKRTSGEIVVSVVESCDEYEHAVWKGAVLGGLGGVLAALALWQFSDVWHEAWIWILVPAPAGALLGYLATASIPTLRRWFATPEVMARRTRQRATNAFVRAEMFKTADRTGILLFLALFEHRVEVLADEGITRTVEQKDWDEIAAGVARGMKQGRPLPELLTAIERCGALLDRHRLHPVPGDRDELPNRVRTED